MAAIRELNSEYCVRSPVAFGRSCSISATVEPLYVCLVNRRSAVRSRMEAFFIYAMCVTNTRLFVVYLIVFNTTNNTFHSICSICTVARTSEHGLN
uniref:Uncharacterized protein n=1 Tax=Heterorhabditis bacteriophora TaxID=37862 RepID=A0A1I7WDR7_HETBA